MVTCKPIEGLSRNALAATASFLLLVLVVQRFARPDDLYRLADRTGTLSKALYRSHVRVEIYHKNIQVSFDNAHAGVSSNGIKYNGRWLSTSNQLGKDVSFGGSNFIFAVHNTSDVFIELANAPSVAEINTVERYEGIPPPLVLNPVRSASKIEGPVTFFHSVNTSANATYHLNAYGIVPLAYKLNPQSVHHFKVAMPYHQGSATFQLRGLWLSTGGQLLPHAMNAGELNPSEGDIRKDNITILLDRPDRTSQTKLVEIMAPNSLLANTDLSINNSYVPQSWVVGWPRLLENNFSNSTISTVPIVPNVCLTSRCGKLNSKPQDTFFRSGPPGTTLHTRLWPFTTRNSYPYALILILGLSDVESFLSAHQTSKHDLPAFVDDLSHTYSTFIQTIRRTAYSPSSLRNMRLPSQQAYLEDADGIDESYLYNSAPSNLPIFLVLPPIPSPLLIPHARQLKAVLHHATSRVLNDLKWHVGDKNTFLIDTAGWLDDADFIFDKQIRKPTSGEDLISAGDFRLAQSGHVKFAYYLSLHLCPHLGESSKGEKCPFDKHSEYVGNLYLPEVEAVGKILEEKRVKRLEELFGI